MIHVLYKIKLIFTIATSVIRWFPGVDEMFTRLTKCVTLIALARLWEITQIYEIHIIPSYSICNLPSFIFMLFKHVITSQIKFAHRCLKCKESFLSNLAFGGM